jgi:hypothetical protein
LGGGAGVGEDFDINSYNERKVDALQGTPVGPLLDQFRLARQASAALVSGLAASDLNKTGRHPFLGVAPVGEIVMLIYRHNQIHQRDIRKTLAEPSVEINT